jgi:hypothetical protein
MQLVHQVLKSAKPSFHGPVKRFHDRLESLHITLAVLGISGE